MARDTWKRPENIIDLTLPEIDSLIGAVNRGKAIAAVPIAGGLANTNIRVDFDNSDRPILLRLFQRDPSQFEKELRINELVHSTVPSPEYFYSSKDNPINGAPYILMEWIEGQRLEVAFPSLSPKEVVAVGNSVGIALSEIHKFTFAQFGFFDSELNVSTQVDIGSKGLKAYADECINQKKGRLRLGDELSDRAIRFIDQIAPLMDCNLDSPVLVHSDFGGSNILVNNSGGVWKVSAVLDWEFAFSGTRYVDFGNLLRKPLGASAAFENAVVSSYECNGGKLSADWKRLALLTDLFAWFDFASREKVGDELIADCKLVIDASIQKWQN